MKKHIIYTLFFVLLVSVTTQAQTVFRGTVIDAKTKQPITNARVGVNNQGVGEITNAKGLFNYKKYHQVLNSESELIVGATGYETLRLDAEKVRTLFNISSIIELEPSTKKVKTKKVQNLTVFWDVSEDMQGRDVEAEIAYVQDYVSAYKNITLQLVVFDYQIRSEELISIRDGDMTRFRESVNGLIYNGPSNYDVLDITEADAVILSSNGNPNYGTFAISQEVPVYTISSKDIAVDAKYMDALATYTQGAYTPLLSSNGTAATLVKKSSEAQGPTIQGKVVSLGKPLQEVSIIKKGDYTEYLTKADGSFELPASDGDILQIRYLGMYPKDVLVEDQKTLAIELLPESDVLDEVVIEKKIEKVIVGDKEIRGRKVSPHIPGGVTGALDFYITADDIKPDAKTLEYVIRENFKRVRIKYTERGIVLLVNEAAPDFYIDGRKVFNIDEALAIVDKDIESIIVKESPTITSRYGPLIEGLAIIITTKLNPLSKKKRENSALVKGNDYKEEVQEISEGIIAGKFQITGKVTSLGKPIQGAVISKKGTFEEYISKDNGSFKIPVSEGDILSVNYLGMYTKSIVVSDDTNKIEVDLIPKSDVLDEVKLSGKSKESINSRVNLETGKYTDPFLGSLDVQTLTREDTNIEGWANMAFGLTGKFSNVNVDTRPGFESLTIRGSDATYYINGTPVDALQFFAVNPANVATVSVKKDIGGIVGRAILIDTIDFVSKDKPVPSALVKGNDYEEEVGTINNGIVSSSQTIKGKITSLGKPIQGATITKQGIFEEYTSKADGSFELPAQKGDHLIVRYLGMQPKGFLVSEDKSYDIQLTPKNDVLDEVVLNGENKSEELKKIEAIDEEYKRKSYTPRVLTQDEIENSNTHNLIDLISGKFSGVQTAGVYPNQVIVNPRSALNSPFGVLLDGVLYDQEILDFINISTIRKVEVINSAFTSAAGQGQGGVIKITTIASDPNVIVKKEIPSALVKGNEYTDEVQSIDGVVASSSKTLIRGVVRNANGFLNDATVTRKGSFDEVYTNTEGRFEIKASLGDVLVVSKVGMYAKEILIESQNLETIELISKKDELDEVIVSGDKRVDNTIETSDGRRVSKDKLGYAVDELTSDSFSSGATNLQQLITGKVSGVSVEGGGFSGSEVVYKIRGGNQSITNNIPPIWIVNGTPYQDPPNFLDVQQIASITVLKSVIATSRYGSLAAGGAFIIKTKEVSFQDKAKKAQQSALVSGNDYNESSTRTIDTSTLPEYILRLREEPNLQDQFEMYQRISRTQESPLEFYVDVAQYFDGVNTKMADQVRADLAYISRNNTKALRTLCYIYEAAGDYKKAALVYERILKIAPSEAQSYRDLALIYQEIGRYNEALELYYNMLGEQIKGVNFKGLEKTLRNELSHLLALHKDKVDYKRFPNEWLRTDFDIDIRMVIDWSDRSVPFEFQFVNPDKKFFKWTHTLEENRERLEKEQGEGYQSEEFIIDDAPQGEWLINIQYLGDEGDYVLPPFLKYTVYRNYGTPQETKEVKIVKLFKQSDKVTLGRVIL